MPKIKYIFFDFWGVVAKLDTTKSNYTTWIAHIYDMPKAEMWQYLSDPLNKFRRGEISEDVFRNMFSKNIDLPLHKDCLEIFRKPLPSYAVFYKSILQFVHTLQKLGYQCVILSDELKPQSLKIRKSGRYNGFDDVLLSCDIGLSKYDDMANNTKKIFTYVFQKYKLQPGEAIFIDDVEENCNMAKRTGIKTVVAKSPRQTIRDIKKILKI